MNRVVGKALNKVSWDACSVSAYENPLTSCFITSALNSLHDGIIPGLGSYFNLLELIRARRRTVGVMSPFAYQTEVPPCPVVKGCLPS